MCGLAGYSGNVNFSPDKFKLLLYFIEQRGKHSAGYYNHKLHISPNNRITKRKGEISKSIIPDSNITATQLIIGHTRHATMGAQSDLDNAHPFLFGDYVGAHNGVLTNFMSLRTHYQFNALDVNLDSKLFFEALDSFEDYRVLEQYDGSAALLFTQVDDKNNTLYAYRDDERPLFRGRLKTTEGDGLYLCSLEAGLEAIGCTKIKSLPKNTLYTIEAGEIIKTQPIKRKPYSVANTHKTNTSKKHKSSKTTTTHSREKETPANSSLELPQYVKDQKREDALKRSNAIVGASTEKHTYTDDIMKIKKREIRDSFSKKDKNQVMWTINVYDDNTTEKYRTHPIKFSKKIDENYVYDPTRDLYLHISYFDDGSYYEVKIQEPHKVEQITVSPEKPSEDEQIADEGVAAYDFLNCVSSWYGMLDEYKTEFKQQAEWHGYKEGDYKRLEEVLSNMEELMSYIVAPADA